MVRDKALRLGHPQIPFPVLFLTSHASIACRKQLLPQRAVGTIGSVWQESTPSKETTGLAQTNTNTQLTTLRFLRRGDETYTQNGYWLIIHLHGNIN